MSRPSCSSAPARMIRSRRKTSHWRSTPSFGCGTSLPVSWPNPHCTGTSRTWNGFSPYWVTTSSPSCGLSTSENSMPTCVRQRATQQESHSPKAPLRACTRRCAASSPTPWRVAFLRTIPRGAPIATRVRSQKRKSPTRKRRRRSSPRWKMRASSTKRTSSSSSPQEYGGASAAPCNGGTSTGSNAPSTSAATP